MSDFLKRMEKEVLIGPGPESLRAQYDTLKENGGWWAIHHPDEYQEILKADFGMGCDYITAGDANRYDLKKFGLQDKALEISRGTLKLAKEVIPDNGYLGFGIMGNLWIPPVDGAGLEKLYKVHVNTIAPALDVGVDFWWVGGADITQILIAVKAIRDNSELPIVARLTVSATPKGFRSMYGSDPVTAAKKYEEAGADVIGISCGEVSYKQTTAVLKEMREACSKPLLAKPNAGVPKLIDGKTVYPRTPEEMANEAPNWVAAGARMVSGCCGTTREHIAGVIAALKQPGHNRK